MCPFEVIVVKASNFSVRGILLAFFCFTTRILLRSGYRHVTSTDKSTVGCKPSYLLCCQTFFFIKVNVCITGLSIHYVMNARDYVQTLSHLAFSDSDYRWFRWEARSWVSGRSPTSSFPVRRAARKHSLRTPVGLDFLRTNPRILPAEPDWWKWKIPLIRTKRFSR